MDHVLEDQIKMGPATLRKSVKPRAEQILELAPPDMVSVVHVSWRDLSGHFFGF